MSKYRWVLEARKRWNFKAEWIDGDGQYALLAHCGVLTVTLHKTLEQAQHIKDEIDKTACGSQCIKRHEIVNLATHGKKPGLTQDDHRTLGAKLSEVRDAVLHAEIAVGNAYPLNSKAYASLSKARRMLDQARSDMENLAFEDIRRNGWAEADFSPIRIYYPHANGD